MNPIRTLKFANLVLFLVFLVIFPGCGGITTPGISQDALSAVITLNTTSGEAPLEVTFDASESSAAQGNEIVSYEWDFGDSKAGEGQTVQHGFDSPGNCTVILTISDNKGSVDTSSVVITVFQPTETVMEQSFDLQNGTEFDTGTGLKVSVSPLSTGGEAKLVVVENHSLQQPGGGFIELQSIYDISLVQESIYQEQKIDNKSSEEPLNVELMFDIPPGTDPNSVVILEWTDAGWVLASSSDNPDSIDSLGGVLTPDKNSIFIELQHLSTYAISLVEFNLGEPVVIPHNSVPSITSDGDMCIDITLESTNWGILNIGAWYQIDVTGEYGFKSVKSLTDPSFGDWGENKGFLSPKENKKLQFTFWGTGGTAPIYLSVRDGWPMALRDYLVRVAGKNLDWPYPSREAMESDFIKKCGIGITETVLTESINILGDELIKVTSIKEGIRSLWKWMRKHGIGNWIRFITTSKLAVDTVGHMVLNQGGYIHYRLIGGILHPLVKVNPAEVVINAGESVQFSASLTTFDGNQMLSMDPSSKWNWEVSGGGSIDGNGLLTADSNTFGTYTIKARTEYFYIDGDKHKVEGEANVIINVNESITTPPLPPTLLSPGSSSAPGTVIDTLTPTLKWQIAFGADHYALAISEYPYGTSNIIYNPQQLYGSSVTVPSGVLESGKKYRWNMQSYNSNSALLSDISNTLYFQILPSNYPPVIISTPLTSATVGQAYNYDVNATDPEDDSLTYSLTEKPTGMTINSSAGLITWTPSATGDYDITVKVSDGIAAVTQSFTITVTSVTPETHTITASAGSNGSISPSGNITVNQESDQSFTITPNSGYSIDDVLVDGSSVGAVSSYTFTNVIEDHAISATFKSSESVILSSITVSPSTMSLVEGGSQTISSITAHYSDGGTADIALDDCAYSTNDPEVATVDTEGVITAVAPGSATIDIIYVEDFIDKIDTVEVTVTPATPNVYTITASAGPNGSISPSGNITVNQGSDQSFTVTPNSGYSIDDVLVDGSSVGAVSSYIFNNITKNYSISATFKSSDVISASIISYSPSSKITVDTGQQFTISTSFKNTGNTSAYFYPGVSIWNSNGSLVFTDWGGKTYLNKDQQGSASWSPTINTPGEYWLQFGVWDEAKSELLDKEPSPSQNLIKVTTPSVSLNFTGLTPSQISTSTAPYQATLSASGSNFNNVNRVSFSWSGAASGSKIWDKDDSNWNAAVTINSDNSMTLQPTVVETNPTWSGTVYWTVTLRDATGATASKSFTVTYTQLTPQVTGVDPSQPTANPSRQYIDILGNNFASNAQVTLQISSSVYPIPDDRTYFINSARIEVYVGLTDSGNWKVWITNPGGQKSNEYIFYVKP